MVEANKGKRTNNRVSWANHKGGSLSSWCHVASESSAATAGSYCLPSKEKSFTDSLHSQWKKGIAPGKVPTPKATYKEALLQYFPQPEPTKFPTILPASIYLTWWADASGAWQRITKSETVEILCGVHCV